MYHFSAFFDLFQTPILTWSSGMLLIYASSTSRSRIAQRCIALVGLCCAAYCSHNECASVIRNYGKLLTVIWRWEMKLAKQTQRGKNQSRHQPVQFLCDRYTCRMKGFLHNALLGAFLFGILIEALDFQLHDNFLKLSPWFQQRTDLRHITNRPLHSGCFEAQAREKEELRLGCASTIV